MTYKDSQVIAVDFDGTIVEHKYPEIGGEMLFAFATLKELQKKGHTLILWTYRTGKFLEEAVNYCAENGIQFYAENENYRGEIKEGNLYSRKLNADIFIDDRNIGGFVGWENVWQMLHPYSGPFLHQLINNLAHTNHKAEKKRYWIFRWW